MLDPDELYFTSEDYYSLIRYDNKTWLDPNKSNSYITKNAILYNAILLFYYQALFAELKFNAL